MEWKKMVAQERKSESKKSKSFLFALQVASCKLLSFQKKCVFDAKRAKVQLLLFEFIFLLLQI